jgi:DNA-directed RNA polymerase subunit alpha
MTMFILNLKQLRLIMDTDDAVRLRLHVSGEGDITAGDLECPAEVEIVNPELHLLTADSPDTDLEIECVVQRGMGYSPAEERERLPIGDIPVDAIFSPVRKTNYLVERARVGQMTDFDRLVVDIWTDGTIPPQVCLRQSAQILLDLFTLVAGVGEVPIEPEEVETEAGMPSRVYDTPIEDLGLSVRAYNCLKRAGITKVGEVLERLEKGEEEILAVRNFGRKSLDELRESLISRGFLLSTGEIAGAPGLGDDSDEDEVPEDEVWAGEASVDGEAELDDVDAVGDVEDIEDDEDVEDIEDVLEDSEDLETEETG